jgi:hypothetical protein
MIHPTDEQLLAGIAEALKDTVLPDLARGSASRKQLQAAIEILRRMAFAGPGKAAALAADNEDMAGVIGRIEAVLSHQSPPPHLPPGDQRSPTGETQKPPPAAGGGLGGGDTAASPTERNQSLQAQLADLQTNIPPDLSTQITPLLTGLYKRMTDRALALIPPPMPRSPRKSS